MASAGQEEDDMQSSPAKKTPGASEMEKEARKRARKYAAATPKPARRLLREATWWSDPAATR